MKEINEDKLRQPIENYVWKAFGAVFLALLFVLSASNFYQGHASFFKVFVSAEDRFIQPTIAAAEKQFNSGFIFHEEWINLYGGTQRIQLKHQIDNFEIIKDDSGFLHMPVYSIDDDTLLSYADNLNAIYEYCEGQGIPLAYLQAPSDFVPERTLLPLGMYYPANNNIDTFLKYIEGYGIPYIDVREYIEDMPLEDIFYKTDHHWALPTTFMSFQLTVNFLNDCYGLQLDETGFYRDLDNYTMLSYPDSFLGSRGIRVGALYAGRDLFRIYRPNYETSFSNEYIVAGESQWIREGDFWDSFINESILENESYNNKYNAFMYGSANQNRIINNLSPNDTRCLLISDSFGRQMVPYLSQCFRETAWIDPQAGRFSESHLEYMEEFKPDCVIVLFNGNSCYVEIPL